MVVAGGWLAPGSVLAYLLALAAYKHPEKRRGLRRRLRHAIACGFAFSKPKRSGSEAASMLLRFSIARTSSVKLGVCTHALEAADQALVMPVGEVARKVSLLETGSDKRTTKPSSLERNCSDSSHRVRDKI
ncbi:hypothetical protein F2Q69_00025359 [Brassica cretica]|uniref:Plant disease resistance WDH domain-containing protein n=1 Tax=Brassica cretica TaxID=69181 RepID=A0A8S9QAL5_BRACR|nr:hypothetical protein F2Q69_00025359 [Brassica cretica]